MKTIIYDPRENEEQEEMQIEYGDLFEWDSHTVLYCGHGLVNLLNPSVFWIRDMSEITEMIKDGTITRLPRGYKITIEQE